VSTGPPTLPGMCSSSRLPARIGQRDSWLTLCLIFVTFLIIGIILYYPGLHSKLIYDSEGLLAGNAHIFARGDLRGVINIVPQRPLFMISLYANYLLTGMDPFYLRVCNIVILAASGVSVAALIVVLLEASGPGIRATHLEKRCIGVLCGLLFVVHPLQCFVVLYVWQRSAILACLFYSSALAVYVAGRSGLLHRPARWHVATSLLFLAGMLSKENVATFPLVALLTEMVLFRQNLRQLGRRALVIAALTVPPLIVTFVLTYAFSGLETSADQRGIVERVFLFYGKAGLEPGEVFLSECRIFFSYLFTIVAPFSEQLQLLKAEIISRSLVNPPVTLAAVAGVVGLVGTAIGLWARRPLVALGILFFIVSLLPESFLIPQYLFFGHRPVLPMVGVLMVAVDALATLWARPEKWARQLAVVAPVLLVACLSATTFSQAKRWNPFSFWQDAYAHLPEYSPDVEKYPYLDVVSGYASELSRSGQYRAAIELYKEAIEVDVGPKSDKRALAMGSLGMALIRSGKTDEGIGYLKEVVELFPRGAWPRYNLGIALYNTGQKDSGLNYIQEAVELYPRDLDARVGLGDIFRNSGRFPEAVAQYRAAAEIAPRSAKIYNLLGIALEKSGALDPAIESYRKAVQLGRDSPEFRFNLGKALAVAGHTEKAIKSYEQAVSLKPDFGPALANLGTLLLRSGRVREAVPCFERALALITNNADLYNQLGLALAAVHRDSEAVKAFHRALALNPDHAAAKQNLERLTNARAHAP
jgi:protein O-mannosyl-transferase